MYGILGSAVGRTRVRVLYNILYACTSVTVIDVGFLVKWKEFFKK